jgi:ribosome recycling factor
MDFNELEERMKKSIESLQDALAEVRAGRANPKILNKVMVDYYGVPTPINQVAGISVPEPRLIVIQPWDQTLLKEIEKAINIAELGLNPMNDGKVIRLAFPELTEDRRKELVKDVKKTGEESKVAIRNIRRDGMDEIRQSQKDGNITEDELSSGEDKIQKLTDKYVGEIDNIISNKEKELMSV